MELKLAFIGFGNVARAFARILKKHQPELFTRYGLDTTTTAIATANHGCITSTAGIELLDAAACVERGGNLEKLPGSTPVADPIATINSCNADILFETTALNVVDGEPATSYIRNALSRGVNVITANKGPIAFAYSELRALASQSGVGFRFEGTVMDGTPVFNLFDQCLPGVQLLGFSGVLNSTTNLILTRMHSGISFAESLEEARRLGIAEANADYDIDGWDAAMKAVALANVLMGIDARPADVERTGIRNVTIAQINEAAGSGHVVRLIARGKRSTIGVRLTVAPEMVPLNSALGSVSGTSNVLVFETDLMGEIAIVETDPGVTQTAYALLSDMLQIHKNLG